MAAFFLFHPHSLSVQHHNVGCYVRILNSDIIELVGFPSRSPKWKKNESSLKSILGLDIDWSRNLRDFPHLKCAHFLFIITFLRRICNSFVIIHRINYQTVFISVQLSYYYVITRYLWRHHTHSLLLIKTVCSGLTDFVFYLVIKKLGSFERFRDPRTKIEQKWFWDFDVKIRHKNKRDIYENMG